MPEGVESTFRYNVELDQQGLAAQLASVRDTVTRGLQGAAGAAGTGLDVISGASNRITSDIMLGQQMLASAYHTQSPFFLPPMGVAGTTLANVPGMPQSFTQELMAASGFSKAPIGIFPGQFQNVAAQRLSERVQSGFLGLGSGLTSMGVGAAAGAALGSVVPGIGNIIGGIGGAILGDVAMAPFIGSVQERMSERARVQQIFGWNQFGSDQRASMADFMRQSFVTSLFSPESFNNVLPAATMAGFFRGVGKNDVSGFQRRFSDAQRFFMEGQFALQLSGTPEDILKQGQLTQGMRRLGIRDPRRAMPIFRQDYGLAQQMREMGEFVDASEITQRRLEMGQAALQFGVAPQRAMDAFGVNTAIASRLTREGALDDDDIALLGGSPAEAAQRMTMGLMSSQRQPLFRAMALAFGKLDPNGRAGIDQSAVEAVAAGGISFNALAERMSQQIGTGTGGASRLMGLLANQQKLQGEMMQNQGQMLRGMTDDLIKQSGLQMDDSTRMFIMQRAFGVGEAESRALVAGTPMEKAERKKLDQDARKLDQDIKSAITTAEGGVAKQMTDFTRGLKEFVAKPLDDLTKWFADKIAPPLQAASDRLESIDSKIQSTTFRSRSPITAGPIDFSHSDGRWMIPQDPMSFQGFRAAVESRRFPEAVLSRQTRLGTIENMTRTTSVRETMAG